MALSPEERARRKAERAEAELERIREAGRRWAAEAPPLSPEAIDRVATILANARLTRPRPVPEEPGRYTYRFEVPPASE